MKILIIGLGSIGLKHIKAIKSIYPKAIIYALRSNVNAKKQSGVINIFHLSEIASINIDFAIISNPTSKHKKTIEQLIEYEFPLFIEKPLLSTLEIGDLINSIESRNIITYVACNLRFLKSLNFVKDKIANHRLNEVNVYCGSFLPDWRPNTDFKKSYSANIELGGGVHFDLIHELDYIYWIFGMPRNVKRVLRSQSSLSISAVDYANYLLDYEGFCVNVVLNYYRRDPKRSLELIFDKETWEVDLLMNRIKVNENILFSSDQRIADTYLTQMEYFLSCIEKKDSTFNNVSDAYNVLKICIDK